MKAITVFWWFMGIAIAVIVVVGVFRDPAPSPHAWTQYAMPHAELEVKRRLRDPNSANFRNVRFFRSAVDGQGSVCGEVNSRNGFGGYNGFQSFFVVVQRGERGQLMVSPALLQSEAPGVWADVLAMCRDGFAATGRP